MEPLPLLDNDDPRLGCELLNSRQIATWLGISDGGSYISRLGLEPVARTMDEQGVWRRWWDRDLLIADGALPPEPFDPTRESWLLDEAIRIGASGKNVMDQLGRRLRAASSEVCLAELSAIAATTLGGGADALHERLVAAKVEAEFREVLVEVGLVRRVGSRWAVRRALLDRVLELSAPDMSSGEVWLADLARERGMSSSRLIQALLYRVVPRDERLRGVPPADELRRRGLGRRIGRRWVIDRAACEALLDTPTHDPATEVTVAELFEEFAGEFTLATNLAKALRHLPSREVILPSGTSGLIFNGDEAREALRSRRRRPGRQNPAFGTRNPIYGAVETRRCHAGPFQLAAPTDREWLTPTDAAWLLGTDEQELRKRLRGSRTHKLPGVAYAHITVAWLEQELLEQRDIAGLRLLAALLDGHLTGGPGIDRATALLQLEP